MKCIMSRLTKRFRTTLSRDEVRHDDVIGDPINELPKQVDFFIAKMWICNHPGELYNGYTTIMLVHGARVPYQFAVITENAIALQK